MFKKKYNILYFISAFLFSYNFSAIAAPMTFSSESNGGNCIGCSWYQARGEITKETPAALRAFFDEKRDPDWGTVAPLPILLDSSGGDLLAAMEVGRILRQEGLMTQVGSTEPYNEEGNPYSYIGKRLQCDGACIFVYLGGRSWGGGEFAVKSYKPPLTDIERCDALPQRQKELNEIAYILAYAREMGFDPSFIYLGKQDGSLYMIDEKEAEKLSLVFDANVIGAWTVEQREGGLVAVARSGNGEKGALFYCNVSGVPYFSLYYKKKFPSDPRGWRLYEADMKASIFNVDVVVTPDNFVETDRYSTFRIALTGVNFSKDDVYGFYFFPQAKVNAEWQNIYFTDKTSMKLYGSVVMNNCLKK